MSVGDEGNRYKAYANKAYAYCEQRILGCISNAWSCLLSDSDRLTALSTFAIFLATAVAVVVGIAQWSALHSTDEKLGRQLSLMEADQRPWVYAAPIVLIGNLIHDKSGLQMTMQFNLRNVGHSPARKAFVSFAASFFSGAGPKITQKVCEDAEKSTLGLILFPGDKISQGIGRKIPETEFAKARDDLKEGRGQIDSILPSITACVAYRGSSDEKFHRTPYDFYLSLPGDASPVKTLLPEGTFPANMFVLVSMPSGMSPD